MEEMGNAYSILVGNPERRATLGIPAQMRGGDKVKIK
jgi:hypothetical protein